MIAIVFSSVFFFSVLLLFHVCVWRFLIQIHCLEWWSHLLKGWYLWEAVLISKSASLRMQKCALIQEWRYSNLYACVLRCMYIWLSSEVFLQCSSPWGGGKGERDFSQLLMASKLFRAVLRPITEASKQPLTWADSCHTSSKLLKLPFHCFHRIK